LALDGGQASTDESGRRAQLTLCHRQSTRTGRGDERSCSQTSRLSDVGDQDRKRTPCKREPDVGVNEATEELQIVREDKEWAEQHEWDQNPTDPRHSDNP
jgi:hypothetical protein